MNDQTAGSAAELVDKAKRLFQFLAQAQRQRTRTPRTVDKYDKVLWWADLPEHSAVTVPGQLATPAPDDVILSITRLPRLDIPAPSAALRPWLDGPIDEPELPATLRDSLFVPDPDVPPGQPSGQPLLKVDIDDRPDMQAAYRTWLTVWQGWAEQELIDRPARALYQDLFATFLKATGHPEELELVVAVGCLAWEPPGHDRILRHFLTAPVAMRFDDNTGTLTVERTESLDAFKVELDMVDSSLTISPKIHSVREDAGLSPAHPLDREALGPLAQRLVHVLDAGGEYRDQDQAPVPSAVATATFAPAIILRKRSQQGIVEIYETIVGQIAGSSVVPDGVIPLLDPNHEPEAHAPHGEGALVHVEDDPFLPLPVNDKQLQIIHKVDHSAQTLVQGPPGTGKTHTVAALLSHLLARGNRVLVTAQTDRALKEVREKLPEGIKPLSVSVVGTSREDMADLKVAVQRISNAAVDHDPVAAETAIRGYKTDIDSLRRLRAGLRTDLIAARADEVELHVRAGFSGSLAAIAQNHQTLRDVHGWLADVFDGDPDSPPPLSGAEIRELHGYLTDHDLAADGPEARLRIIDIDGVPEPGVFADQVVAESDAAIRSSRWAEARSHVVYPAVSQLHPRDREQLKVALTRIGQRTAEIGRRPERWLPQALQDVLHGHAARWSSREKQVAGLIQQCEPVVGGLGPLLRVEVDGAREPLLHLARGLRVYLATGGKLKVETNGQPKIGAFATKLVKQAEPLFAGVRINGLPPTDLRQLDGFLAWGLASAQLDALDRAWPDNADIPAEDTPQERLTWHITEVEQLRRVLEVGADIDDQQGRLAALQVPSPDWPDPAKLKSYVDMVDAAMAADEHATASAPIKYVEHILESAAKWDHSSPAVTSLHSAAKDRDQNSYATAYHRIARLIEVRRADKRRFDLTRRLIDASPALAKALEAGADDPAWDSRLKDFESAWSWAATGAWIKSRSTVDVNAIQAEITKTEDRIRNAVETLAATRAWNHAVSKDRLTGQARADLNHYAGLVKRLGKGTGKYATARKAEIRQAMDRCRPAVPVWIMPIYRIAEQLRISPDMFDVVIVDEASQAGLEATFLQYLAPKMVIVGDDKQVSPSAVGVDQQKLRDLATQWIPTDRYKSSWQDPKRSLFDEAKMRYGGVITLTEHRRCMPEIIGFSNRIAYEPEGIPLIPVRQYGLDRLEPIKPVHVRDGYMQGAINPAEVDAIVDQIEKCLGDPTYDGKTFGVISLLGTPQASAIEKALLDRIQPEELTARDIRCGDSADFQGSERDVMFLSMVKAVDEDSRVSALTAESYVQRYNVAASRAKDQMWVFHSIALADLGNPEDMRFQLLDYCYGVRHRTDDPDIEHSGRVSDDVRTAPFDSLFEQRVFNRLIDRGYTVHPQYEVSPYRIDLVVFGARNRLAIECDGDFWHGPDRYAHDLARQRDLERCGWTFFRIRASDFYIDERAVLDELWSVLHEREIHPSGWTPPKLVDVRPTRAVSESSIVLEHTQALDSELPSALPGAAEWPSADGHLFPDDNWEEPEPEVANFAPVIVNPESVAKRVVVEPSQPTLLARYEVYGGSLPPVTDARPMELADDIVAIVATEGPMLIGRLQTAYVQASGGQKVGASIATTLNRAIESATRRGLLIRDNPLTEQEMKAHTVRLPSQQDAVLRELGPRGFDLVPPAELAALLTVVAEGLGWEHRDALYRETLRILGLVRLTDNVRARFDAVLTTLAAPPNGTGLSATRSSPRS